MISADAIKYMERWSGGWSEIPPSFVVPEAVRLQVGDSSSMQCFHCQTVCSGRDSWSPISQSIWQLQQKVLSPVNIKQRRTEHCKAFWRKVSNRAGSTLVHCHPEIPCAGPVLESIQINVISEQLCMGVGSSPLEPACPAGLLWQDSSVPWELLLPPPALKGTQGCSPLSDPEIKTWQTEQLCNSLKCTKQVW